MLPAVTSFAARADMKGAGSVFSIFAIADSARTLRLAAPSGTISSSSTGTPALAICAAIPAPMTPAPMTVAFRIGCMRIAPLDPFQNRGDALTAADTLGGQRITTADALQETGRFTHDTRAGCAQRMSESDGAAIEIEGRIPDPEIASTGERLAGEGLVQ